MNELERLHADIDISDRQQTIEEMDALLLKLMYSLREMRIMCSEFMYNQEPFENSEEPDGVKDERRM